MVSSYRLQEQITGMMLAGASLDRVEAEVIEPSGLSPERKTALWLWALSYVAGTDQRVQANSFLTELS